MEFPETAPEQAAEPIMLELVNPDGETIGVAEKLSAHQAPGRLHRAFSVFLLDPEGRLLLQQRALTKYHSPGVWSNTCCGHPYPGEAPEEAATRRTREELGYQPADLRPVGTVTYDHPDPISGLVEREYNHLFVGSIGAPDSAANPDAVLRPDPEEIHDTRFVSRPELARMQESGTFSAWFPTVLDAALPGIRQSAPTGGW